jgi:hypothetical protein
LATLGQPKKRKLPEFAGPSARLTSSYPSEVDDEVAAKPLKAHVPVYSQASVPSRVDRRARKHDMGLVDEELLYYLRLEALFRDRTPALLMTLKIKARGFLTKFDVSRLSQRELFEMIATAVGHAMDIPPEEHYVRQHCKRDDQEDARHKNHDFLVNGNAGVSGALWWSQRHSLPKA